MGWGDIETRIRNRNVLADGAVPTHIENLLSSRYDAYLASETRRKNRYTSDKSKFFPFDYSPQVGTLIFYAEYYQNLKLNNDKLTKYFSGYPNTYCPNRTPRTKRKNHLKDRFAPLINQAFKDFKKQYSRSPIDDDEMIEFLYTRLPQTAFDKDELDLWKRMYLYAHKQGTYTAVKRSDRRTKHIENTYLDFAKWILTNFADSSSNDRYFITGFLADCKNNGLTVSRATVDGLLRYDASPECFAEGDLTALGFNTPQQQTAFFDALQLIKDASKKSSR